MTHSLEYTFDDDSLHVEFTVIFQPGTQTDLRWLDINISYVDATAAWYAPAKDMPLGGRRVKLELSTDDRDFLSEHLRALLRRPGAFTDYVEDECFQAFVRETESTQGV